MLAASPPVLAGFIVLPLALAATLVLGIAAAGRGGREAPEVTRRWIGATAGAVAAWLCLTWVVAARGVLRRFDATPPPFLLLGLAVVGLGLVIGCSPVGTRLVRGLPLSALVGVQAFRFPLELLMHRAYTEGLMPVQMSYSGRNFDILTGVTAGLLGLALVRWRVPRWLVMLWNVVGLALLVNIVTVAVLSTPMFRWFGDDRLNTWVTYPPFVWLPAMMVLVAWTGHVLVFRKLGSRDGARK
jgi:type IV secretory pathway TrbD component